MNWFPSNLGCDVRNQLEDCMRRFLRKTDTIYDVGCGSKPFSEFLSDKTLSHLGIGMDGGFYGEDSVDIIGVADALPVADGVADAESVNPGSHAPRTAC